MDVLDNFKNVQNFIDKSMQKSRFGVGQQGNIGSYNDNIDLNGYIIRNKNSTFFFKLATDIYTDKGIHNGSIVVIDRSFFPEKDDVVLCFIDGQYVLKDYLEICNDPEIEVWGVLSKVINSFR